MLALKAVQERRPDFIFQYVLFAPDDSTQSEWKNSFDEMTLIVKVGVFTKEELQSLLQASKLTQSSLVATNTELKLEKPFSDLEVFNQNLAVWEMQVRLAQASGMFFAPHSDDRPFIFNIHPKHDILSLEYWHDVVRNFDFSPQTQQNFILIFIILAALVLLASLLLKSASFISSLEMCFLGFFSTGFTILTIYKSLLFLGTPTWAIVIAQSLSLIAGWIGTQFSTAHSQLRWYHLVLLIVWGQLFASLTSSNFFSWSYLIFLTLCFPLPFLSAFLFSRILTKEKIRSPKTIPLYLSSNLFGGVVAALAVPFLIESLGFHQAQLFVLIPLLLSFRKDI